ncbi:AfsR/SARP family transcriptional regulator [Kibdelosporangium aridum]|uniref:AfsR/SARP family transcriptional regulator n=1 Tax=Kibdelosporangium aridum TaxID=2030 RepID=UPI0035E4D981
MTIVHRSSGYMLVVDQANQAVDVLRFRDLRDRARDTDDDTHKMALLTEALTLWRGEPLTGLSGQWVESERERWQHERWAAEHDLIDAQLRTGHGEELVAQLSTRAAQHPLDERVAGQYMLTLHRAGRSADALDHYQHLRKHLIEELGTDPGSALRNLQRQILAADPSLMPRPSRTTVEPVVVPRHLPAAPASFVGRRNELDRLDTTLRPGIEPADATGAAVLISALGGAAAGSARPGLCCTGLITTRTGSPTDNSSSTCAASALTAARSPLRRQYAASSPPLASIPGTSPPTWTPKPPCTEARSRASAC